MINCTFKFNDPNRPRATCGLPCSKGSHCVWHDSETRGTTFDVRTELEKEITKEDHWLEGAQLSNLDLSKLNLFSAKLPSADLQMTDLSSAFLAMAYLNKANLLSSKLDNAKINSSILTKANLDNASAVRANFEAADLSGASLLSTDFEGAYLHRLKVSEETLSYNTSWGLPGEFMDSQFDKAAHIFRTLNNYYRLLSDYDRSLFFYYLEMTSLHLSSIHAHKPPIGSLSQKVRAWLGFKYTVGGVFRWIGWGIHRWLWGYGIRPLRILIWMISIILLYGLVVFPIIGIRVGQEVIHSIKTGINLSIITFATLGYGNKTPEGNIGEFFGGMEALLGAVLLAAFLVSLASRYVHRG